MQPNHRIAVVGTSEMGESPIQRFQGGAGLILGIGYVKAQEAEFAGRGLLFPENSWPRCILPRWRSEHRRSHGCPGETPFVRLVQGYSASAVSSGASPAQSRWGPGGWGTKGEFGAQGRETARQTSGAGTP